MDLLTIVKIALFVPFLLVLTIFAIVYLIAGHKKDLGRSIVSLLATAVSVCLGLLLAKLLSFLLSGPIYSAFTSAMGGAGESFGTFGEGFLKGIIEIVLSFVLFVLFFIIALAVLKTVGKKINWGKLEKLNTGKKGTRIAGMAVRAIDAVLVSVMLLLPLYGTIAMVAPPAATLVKMTERTESPAQDVMQAEDDGVYVPVQFAAVSYASATPGAESDEPNASEVLDVLANHPVLVPYKYGPGAWVYTELSTFSMNGKQVDIATAAESLEGLLNRFENFVRAVESEDEAKVISATDELVEFARKKVINQRWSYDMIMAFVGEVDGIIKQYSPMLEDEDELKFYNTLRPLFDMSFEEYTHNAEGILDFAAWGLDKYDELLKIATSGEVNNFTDADALIFMSELMDEVYDQIGTLINYSDQAVGLKRIILLTYAEMRLFDTVPSSTTAAQFIDRYYGDGYVDEKDRRAEALAFITLMDASSPLDVAAAFACNPMFGADAVIETFGNNLYIHGLSIGSQLNTNDRAEEAFNTLNGMLRAYKGNSMIQFSRFSDQAERYLIDEIGLEYGYYGDGGFSHGSGADVQAVHVMMGEDGKMYVIPSDIYYEIVSRGELTEETIKEFGLQSIDMNITEDGEGSISYGDVEINIDGDFSYSDIEGGISYGDIEIGSRTENGYFVTVKP